MKLRLVPQLSQKLIMTPQLQQAIKLLQLSATRTTAEPRATSSGKPVAG